MRNAIMTNIDVSLVMHVDVFDNVLVKTVDSICLFVRKLVSEDINVEVTNSWQKLLRFLTVNMVQYSLDCKEGHMKKIRLSVCIEVKRKSI